MKILLTGCAGFIGWKVGEFLLEQGHNVIGVDNLNDAYDVRLKQWRLARLQEKPNFIFYCLDIIDRQGLLKLFKSSNVAAFEPINAVINLAARAGVRQSLADPWAFYETNLTGTLNLLTLCRTYNVNKFVLASTSSLYGEGERPFREDQTTDRPLSPYAASKKAAETLCYTYHRLYQMDVTVLRYFTVYGPAGRPDMSIFRFTKWIAEGEPVVVYGDGEQERDFTYIDDIARGTLAALKPVGFEAINLGSDRPVPLKSAIALIEERVGHRAHIERQPAHPADALATWAEIGKARRLLAWMPQITLEVGLQRAVEWYMQHRSWAREITG